MQYSTFPDWTPITAKKHCWVLSGELYHNYWPFITNLQSLHLLQLPNILQWQIIRNREYVFMYGLLGIASLEHGDFFQCVLFIQKLVSVVHIILTLADSWETKITYSVWHLGKFDESLPPNEHVNCGFCLCYGSTASEWGWPQVSAAEKWGQKG